MPPRAAAALLTPICQPGGGPCAMRCRRKTFTNLTADQLALARDGTIPQHLRSASPVFYWQTTRQHRSRREAVCTKNTAWHATTFGSHGKFADLARMKCRRAAQVRPVISTCTNLTLQDLPPRWAKANGATRGSRGAGYWRWKPYTLLRRLQALGDGEVPRALLNRRPPALLLAPTPALGPYPGVPLVVAATSADVGQVLVHFDYDLAIGHNLSALYCLGQVRVRVRVRVS
jgi:hypothetical protein